MSSGIPRKVERSDRGGDVAAVARIEIAMLQRMHRAPSRSVARMSEMGNETRVMMMLRKGFASAKFLRGRKPFWWLLKPTSQIISERRKVVAVPRGGVDDGRERIPNWLFVGEDTVDDVPGSVSNGHRESKEPHLACWAGVVIDRWPGVSRRGVGQRRLVYSVRGVAYIAARREGTPQQVLSVS